MEQTYKLGNDMDKKNSIKKYFDSFHQPELPKTVKKKIVSENETHATESEAQKKIFTTHKIYDAPEDNLNNEGMVISIDPNIIERWEHKDRPENELGDIDSFANVLKTIGQLQPGIVRPSGNQNFKYELLVGERRWLACKSAGIKFKAIVADLNDLDAAIAQAVENEDREKLSDYARGISYADKIKAGILKQKDLIEKLGKSKQEISRLLSYREIPNELIEAIHDMRKVSPYTAEVIKQLCKQDPVNTELLIKYADKIRSGCGNSSILKYVKATQIKDNFMSEKVLSKNGRHLFTLRKDGNGNQSISFPKDINENTNLAAIKECLIKEVENQLHLV